MHPQGTSKAPASSLTIRADEADRDGQQGRVKAMRGWNQFNTNRRVR
ncbi:MAG: hypothetical protein HF976_08040 [ANME-2 cluster archaeon]|nr:hypothetical protein [ANME-2 cluster archaeon]MBC2701345.1 hypothetical protein [ANME-2 cluster archaeon]MBC2708447.1 hypothetical protein [ANME-2 cluster archaeon]MBC2745658.1 hypothetical protein [ANME-2 cluster archaeon]